MKAAFKRLYDWSPITVQDLLLAAFSSRLNRWRCGGRFPEFQALLEESQ